MMQRANLHAKYTTSPERWFDWVGAKLALFEEADVLEAGCGTGLLWTETAVPIPGGLSLTLTDLSAGMVDEATVAAEATGRFISVEGRQADLQDLPLPDRAYDRVVANHMLYHLPDPGLGVAEMARVVRADGTVIATTNGRRHLRQLWEIRARVFGTRPVDETADVFSPEIGFGLLRENFAEVVWIEYPDELRCTDPVDVMAHICSTPPAETAGPEQLAALEREVADAFEAGGGELVVTKEVGVFVCHGPRKVEA